jgi:hypothetical protein
LKYPPKLKKLSIYTPEFSIALNLDPSVQIRAQIFEKDQNTPDFNFLKKLKNILEVEILNSEF